MFWVHYGAPSPIDELLNKDDCTLQELLDQENVLQEFKGQNKKILDFMLKPDMLQQLIAMITTEPDSEISIQEQYRYSNIACELLTSDSPAVNERLAQDHDVLNMLYSFLERDPPLNPLLASYCCRTFSVLICRKYNQNWVSYQMACIQTLEFLKSKGNFIRLLFKHIGTSAVVDLSLDLFTSVEGVEIKNDLNLWLQQEDIVGRIISLMSPLADTENNKSACDLLCSMIDKLRDIRDNLTDSAEKPQSDPILDSIESVETVQMILDIIFNVEFVSESSVLAGLTVLLKILKSFTPNHSRIRKYLEFSIHERSELENCVTNGSSTSSEECSIKKSTCNSHSLLIMPTVLEVLASSCRVLHNILANPPAKSPLLLTTGKLDPPLGNVRLMVIKFVGVLVSINDPNINRELIKLSTLKLIYDLFFQYEWNNFLHAEVEKIFSFTIEHASCAQADDDSDLLFAHIIKDCWLLGRIRKAWDDHENSVYVRRKDHSTFGTGVIRRPGYMGHLVRFAGMIHFEETKNASFATVFRRIVGPDLLNEWYSFFNDCIQPVLVTYATPLGGTNPFVIMEQKKYEDVLKEESKFEDARSFFEGIDSVKSTDEDATCEAADEYGRELLRNMLTKQAWDIKMKKSHNTGDSGSGSHSWLNGKEAVIDRSWEDWGDSDDDDGGEEEDEEEDEEEEKEEDKEEGIVLKDEAGKKEDAEREECKEQGNASLEQWNPNVKECNVWGDANSLPNSESLKVENGEDWAAFASIPTSLWAACPPHRLPEVISQTKLTCSSESSEKPCQENVISQCNGYDSKTNAEVIPDVCDDFGDFEQAATDKTQFSEIEISKQKSEIAAKIVDGAVTEAQKRVAMAQSSSVGFESDIPIGSPSRILEESEVSIGLNEQISGESSVPTGVSSQISNESANTIGCASQMNESSYPIDCAGQISNNSGVIIVCDDSVSNKSSDPIGCVDSVSNESSDPIGCVDSVSNESSDPDGSIQQLATNFVDDVLAEAKGVVTAADNPINEVYKTATLVVEDMISDVKDRICGGNDTNGAGVLCNGDTSEDDVNSRYNGVTTLALCENFGDAEAQSPPRSDAAYSFDDLSTRKLKEGLRKIGAIGEMRHHDFRKNFVSDRDETSPNVEMMDTEIPETNCNSSSSSECKVENHREEENCSTGT